MRNPPKIVAEFTTNHLGNMNLLLKMVECASMIGCDFIKMQKKDVHSFYSRTKLSSKFLSPYGKTFGDYRSIFEFDKEDFLRFDAKCKQFNLKWFATVQDIPSLNFLLDFDREIYKIASINSRNLKLLSEISKSVPKDKTIVISVAGSTLNEIDRSLNILSDHRLYVLHCVAQYPCKTQNLHLGNIEVLKTTFEDRRISVGYSGHEVGYLPTIAAADMGSEMIERHFCLSRHSFAHHIECSLEPDEFKQMADILKKNKSIRDYYKDDLSPIAFDSYFGMKSFEEAFFNNREYCT